MAQFDDLIEAQLDGATIRVATLVHFDFASAPMRLWQGAGDLVIDGVAWAGIGEAGAMSAVQAGVGGAVEEVEFALFGSADMLANLEADANESAGREVNIHLQFFDIRQIDEAGTWVDWQPLGDLISAFWGVMGPMRARRDPPSAGDPASRVLTVTAQSAFVNRARPAFGFFTDADQRGREIADGGAGTDNIFIRMPEFSQGRARWPQY